jgi:hypothetical protein
MSSNIDSERTYPEVISSSSEGYRDIHGTYPGYQAELGALPVAKQEGSSVIIPPYSDCAE